MSETRFLCQIRAAAESDDAEILIYDDIGASSWGDGVTAKQFVRDLSALDAKTLTVRINSAGGDVFEGLAIHHAIRRHKATVTTEIDGLAASIASIIALAGDEVRMSDNAFFMIHDPWGMGVGNAKEMRELADLLDKVGGSLANVYAEKTGRDVTEVQDWMTAETWFNADEALAAGFVDKLVKGKKIAARADLTGFRNAPSALKAALDGLHAPTPEAAGGAAPVATLTPNQQAVEAMEGTMSVVDNAAQAAAIESARAEERTRISAIRALAREHNMPQDQVDTWIDDAAVTVGQVKDQILAQIRAAAAAAPHVRATVGAPREESAPFASFGEQLLAVYRAHPQVTGEVDPRLSGLNRKFSLHAAATGMSQGDPQSGGFLVAPQFSQGIWDGLSEGDENLLAMVDSYPVEGESLTFNANAETSRATGSRWGGVRAYWIAEADQITGSRPKFRQVKVEPQQLAVMVYLTDKLLNNAPSALDLYVRRTAVSEINFMTGDSIIRGTGAGKPLGLLNSGSLVTVPKETNQAAASIYPQNISKMWGRLHPRFRSDAVWLHNVDVEPQFDELNALVKNVAGTENVGGYAPKVYDAEKRTLKGRPIVATEFCETLGTVGDLILWSPSGYLAGVRSALQSAMSMHIRFDYAETAFRFIYEVDGQPWLQSALTPYKGTNTLTTHVALATRS